MTSITLTFGFGLLKRTVPNADELLREYRKDTGCYYLVYRPITSPDEIYPEDIAVTLLVNTQVGWRAFHSLHTHGKSFDLTCLPTKPLEPTSPEERRQFVAVIAKWAEFSGFAAISSFHQRLVSR